jgi:hypothetical protein
MKKILPLLAKVIGDVVPQLLNASIMNTPGRDI